MISDEQSENFTIDYRDTIETNYRLIIEMLKIMLKTSEISLMFGLSKR